MNACLISFLTLIFGCYSEVFRIPQTSKLFLTGFDFVVYYDQLAFAISTKGFGTFFQQPQFVTSKDYLKFIITEEGLFSIAWKYKGLEYSVTSNNSNIRLNDGLWHVTRLRYLDEGLLLYFDESESPETLTTLPESPTLFALRTSNQDSNLVVGADLSDSLCVEFGKPFAQGMFWNSEGNVMTSLMFKDNCSEVLDQRNIGVLGLNQCSDCNETEDCFLLVEKSFCSCRDGQTDINCDIESSPCDHYYCGQNGNCSYSDEFRIPFCDCDAGFAGDFCEVLAPGCASGQIGYRNSEDEKCYRTPYCSSGPCYNRGACTEVDSLTPYNCDCPDDFLGENCERSEDNCDDGACSFNGQCVDLLGSHFCMCNTGWTGTNCEEDLDICAIFSPCGENGHCTNTVIGSADDGSDQSYFECSCDEGWTGRKCEEDVNECEEFEPCANGGSCANHLGSYKCSCSSDWTGVNCTENVDDCIANDDCGENETCVDQEKDHICVCEGGFVGENCDENICAEGFNPCANGGSCTFSDGSYTCDCVGFYDGENCTEVIDACTNDTIDCPSGQVCYNDATSNTGYTCQCPEGFEGDSCNDDIDECELGNPCDQGTCENSEGSFECICNVGYEGVLCESDIDECVNDPCNGGTCADKVNGFECSQCPPGFHGKFCQSNNNDCSPNPCQNALECIDLVADYECVCEEGYTGQNCEIEIDECDPNLCLNGGECVDLIGGYSCNCSAGFSGSNCQSDINECAARPCQNGGICTDGTNDYSCDCTDTGFQGRSCEVAIDDCLNVICYHGARCQDEVNAFTCQCNPGYSGTFCEVDFPDCAANPCKNGGVCLEVSKTENYPRIVPLINRSFSYTTAQGYACECAEGFQGTNCETPVDYCLIDNDCIEGNTEQCNSVSPQEGYYECQCLDGFEGEFCQVNIDDCLNDPCQNEGQCVDGVNGYSCVCEIGFAGENCTTELTSCDSNECKNNANCVPTYNQEDESEGYDCHCTPGFTGSLCDVVTDLDLSNPFVFTNASDANAIVISLRIQTTLTSRTIFEASNFSLILDVQGKLVFKFESETLKSDYVVNHGSWVDIEAKVAENEMTLNYTDDVNCAETCPPETVAVQIPGDFIVGEIKLGSSLGANDASNFIGCVEDFIINSQLLIGGENGVPQSVDCVRENQCNVDSCSGHGRCIDLWDSFECLCNPMFAGATCEEDLSQKFDISAGTFNFNWACANDESYARQEFTSDDVQQVSFHVKTVEKSGVVFQHGSKNSNTPFRGPLIEIDGSQVSLSIAGDTRKLDIDVTDGLPHHFLLDYEDADGNMRFSIDNASALEFPFPSPDLRSYLKFHPFSFSASNDDLEDRDPFKGCISDVRVKVSNDQGIETFYSLKFDSAAPNIGGSYVSQLFTELICIEDQCDSDPVCDPDPCLNDGTCSFTWNQFTCDCPEPYAGQTCKETDFCSNNTCSIDVYCVNSENGFECHEPLSLKDGFVKAEPLSNVLNDVLSGIQFTLRTRQTPGLLFHMEGSDNSCFVNSQLSGNNLLLNFQFGSSVDANAVNIGAIDVSDGALHTVLIEFSASGFTVKVDGTLIDQRSGIFTLPSIECVSGSGVWIGGVGSKELTQTQSPSVSNPQPAFDGCLDNFRVNDLFVPLKNDSGSNLAFEYLESTGYVLGCVSDACENETLCQQGGTCQDLWRDYACQCVRGFEGQNCETNIDDCPAETACSGHGTCIDGINKFSCECSVGFEGDSCQFDKDECQNSICQNGANCTNTEGGYTCDCLEGFEGENCEVLTINTLECSDSPCVYGSCTAINSASQDERKFSCTCNEGFTGEQCETAEDLCDPLPCSNANKCEVQVNEEAGTAHYSCDCILGWEGLNCTEQTDFCEDSPCSENSQCVNAFDRYQCNCDPGFKGTFCDTNIDECEEVAPCNNANTLNCQDTIGSYTCACKFGFEGVDCDVERNFCDPAPCERGECSINLTNEESGFDCDCEGTGFFGDRCENDINECEVEGEDGICLNGASCVNTEGSYSCDCTSTGFQGVSCNVTCFANVTCLNEGSCANVDETTGEGSCQCIAGFEGDACEFQSEQQTGDDDVAFASSTGGIILWVIIGVVVVLLVIVLLAVLIVKLRGSRAKTGEYKPKNAESNSKAFQIPIEFADLRPPKEERLI